jgi:hypothetical protein
MMVTSSREPKLVAGPLAVVAVVGLWRGLRRRRSLATAIGLAAAAAELGWPGYQQFRRRWMVVSYYEGGDRPDGPSP